MGGGVVEQDYASLVTGCGTCLSDCWTSRLVVVGPPWRVSLDNPSCRTFYKEPASNGNTSTITTAREQCQTQIPRRLQQCFISRAWRGYFRFVRLRLRNHRAALDGQPEWWLSPHEHLPNATRPAKFPAAFASATLPLLWIIFGRPGVMPTFRAREKASGAFSARRHKRRMTGKARIVYRGSTVSSF